MDFPASPQTTEDFPRWCEAMSGHVPTLDASIAFLVAYKATVSIAPPHPKNPAIHGTCVGIYKHIYIYDGAHMSGDHLCKVLSHETKHLAQSADNPAALAWEELSYDIFDSLRAKEYRLKERYDLPSVANDILMRLLNETDAHAFAWLCARESRAAFMGEQQTPVTQDTIDGMIFKRLNDAKMIGAQSAEFIQTIYATLVQLKDVTETHKKIPAIRFMPVSANDIAHGCSRLWGSAGLKTPLQTKEGLQKIGDLRTWFLNHPGCIHTAKVTTQILSAAKPQPKKSSLIL